MFQLPFDIVGKAPHYSVLICFVFYSIKTDLNRKRIVISILLQNSQELQFRRKIILQVKNCTSIVLANSEVPLQLTVAHRILQSR